MLVEIKVDLARLEAKLDGVIQLLADQKRSDLDHETRLRAVEKSSWKVQGVAACIALVVAAATGIWMKP